VKIKLILKLTNFDLLMDLWLIGLRATTYPNNCHHCAPSMAGFAAVASTWRTCIRTYRFGSAASHWCRALKLNLRYASNGAIASNLRPHQYKALSQNKREIRLLLLLPGETGDPVSTKIRHIYLQEHNHSRVSDWTCVSYSWRNAENQKELVWMNGEPFLVTANLYKALHHLRSPSEPRLLWVDQMCIDQRNVAERNWQVQIMGEIFQSASSVVAWLGVDDWSTRTIIDMLSTLDELDIRARFSQPYDDGTTLHPALEARNGKWLWQRLLSFLENDEWDRPPKPRATRILTDLFIQCMKNPWFDRLWVVQEAALAKQLFLQCGPSVSSWEAFKAALDTLYIYSNEKRLDRYWYKMMSIHHVRSAVVRNNWLASFPLSTLVQHHRNRLAVNDRDKIYALLGLTKSEYFTMNWVDYGRTVQSVYSSFSRRCIKDEGNLNILKGCCVGRKGRKYNLPSWATDWTEGHYPDRQDSSGLCGLAYSEQLQVDDDNLVDTRFRRQAVFSTESKGLIQLAGVQIDIVQNVAQEAHFAHLIGSPSSLTWAAWEKLVMKEWGPLVYPTKASRREAFWRTMIAGLTHQTQRDASDLGQQFEQWWNQAAERTHHLQDDEQQDESFKYPTDFRDWLSKLYFTIRPNSRLFLTQRGFIGLTCEHTVPGDKVCLLWGGRFPFLLREQASESDSKTKNTSVVRNHALVGGEAYVHGLADQAFKIVEDEGISEQVFHLI